MSRIALHNVVVNDGRLTQIMYNLYIYNYIQEYYCQYRCTHSEPHHSSITKSKTSCEENYFSQLLCRYSDLWMVRQVILIFNVREHRQDYINIYNLTRHICVTENTLSCAYATHSNSTFLVVMLKTQITGTHYVILLMIHFEYFQKIFNVVTNCNVMGHTRTKSKGKSKVQFFSNFVSIVFFLQFQRR